MAQRFGRKMLWVFLRGSLLGLSLAAFYPTSAVAGCQCDDWGSGAWRCPSGAASSCEAGAEKCDVSC